MARVRVLSVSCASIAAWRAIIPSCAFIRIIVVIFKEGSGRGGCCLACCFLEFSVEGFLLATTVEVPCKEEDDGESDESYSGEYTYYCWCVLEKSSSLRSDLGVQWIKIEGGKEGINM